MRIRFVQPATARISFQPGDEIVVAKATPELEILLGAVRIDGAKVAEIADDEEVAVVSSSRDEAAVVGRGRRHAQRPASVS